MRHGISLPATLNNQGKPRAQRGAAATVRTGQATAKSQSQVVLLQSAYGNQGMLRLLNGGVLQRKLAINRPGDVYEQEADRMADKVMRMTEPPPNQQSVRQAETSGRLQRCSCGKSATGGQPCEECKAKSMHRKENSAGLSVTFSSGAAAPAIVHEVLRSPGRPLDLAARSFMEPRFGHDFGGVRVHNDRRAVESAQAVNGLAYTVGRDIVFGVGQYAPQTQAGSRLLAHELSHVMQQSPVGGLVQGEIRRKEKDPEERRDLAFVLSKDLASDANALAPGATQIFANSLVELSIALKKVSSPIKTLFIVGHGSPTGSLTFGDSDPFMGGLQKPEAVASAVRGRIPVEYSPQTVDFRACNIGKNPKALELYREAFGAKDAIGASCFLFVYEKPLTIGGKEIKKRSDINQANRKAFEEGLERLPESFPESYRPCISDKSEEAFFKAGGKMIAAFYGDRGKNSRKNICLQEMQPETVDPKTAEAITGCELVRVAESEKKSQEKGKLPKE
jgi:hypothetical protein